MFTTFMSWPRRAIAVAAERSSALAQRFVADVRGIAAIEMALIFPMMMIVYFGMVDITNLLSANRRVTWAASTLADLVTQAPGVVTKADLYGFYNAIQPIMDPFPAADVNVNLFGYFNDGGTPKLKWQDARGGSCGAPSTTGMADLMAEGNDIVVASVCVTYEPLTGKVVGSGPFTLADEIFLRPRQNLTIDCPSC